MLSILGNRKSFVFVLELLPLTTDLLPAALELDQRALGGIWTREGYLREIGSPNSELLVFRTQGARAKSQAFGVRSQVSEESPNLTSNIQHGDPESGVRSQESGEIQNPKSKIQNCHSPFPLLSLGCLWAIAEEAHITLLAVDPDYQRQGLGQGMLYVLLRLAHGRGLERATLEVRVSNSGAIALYEKFGFREAGRRKRYYQDTGEDGLILWLGGLHRSDFPAILDQWQQEIRDRLQMSGWKFSS